MFFLLMTCCLQSRSQEVIHSVSIQKMNNNSFEIKYQLNPSHELDVAGTVLKVFRRRDGKVEEVFSKNIADQILPTRSRTIYNYNWKPEDGLVKTGDELQAKIVLSLKPSLAKQKTKGLNKTPYANAGDFRELTLPFQSIALNGSKSHDEDGKIVSVQWKQIAGPTDLSISKKDSLMASANGEFKEGAYAFELSVKDDRGATAISRTILNVHSAPLIVNTPVAKNNVPKKENSTFSNPMIAQKTKTKLKGGPTNAAINLLVPGLGHYFVSGDHNGDNRKLSSFVLTAAYAGSIGGAFYFQGRSNSQYKKYSDLAAFREYQKDANGIIIGMRGVNEAEANKYFSSARSAHRNALICLGVGGAVLTGDLIYTFLKGSKNKREWKRESTSFKPDVFISSDGFITTAGVQFKF